MIYINVAIAKQHTRGSFFSYEAPDSVVIGDIISVPFGKKITYAIVVAIVKKPTFDTKPITAIHPYKLPNASLLLMHWMYDFYPDDNGLITQLFIPSTIIKTPKKQLAKTLQGNNLPLPKSTIEQATALSQIYKPSSKRVLLHGDTGTGKTHVFVNQAQRIIQSGKSVLILTPEIGLTPQLVSDIQKHINAPIVTTHSNLTPVERRRVWEYALANQQPTVYVGPRSALFLPFQDLGLIVVDEAHDSSYKQGQSPRYQALHIATKLAGLHDAQLILSTATPNVDDYDIAKAQGYSVLRMKTPAAGNLEHSAQIIDITNRDLFIKSPYLADTAVNAIEQAIIKGEQSMVFLNRRGSARLVQCATCGWQALCPHCGLPLTYHHDLYTIRCHTCSYSQPAPSSCPSCHGTELSFKSIGTKSLVDHLAKLFPTARIQRFDADSTASEQYYKHIDSLKNGEVDIIVGTQIISKGIDLPHLSVVAVINADSGLNLPDFRAEETTFQQLYQVTGRAGRGHILSKSFIQTRVPTHPLMEAVLQRSWENYYVYEQHKRKQFTYPPYCYLAVFKVSKKTAKAAEETANKAVASFGDITGIAILGPSPSFYERTNDLYSWQIIAKSSKRSKLISLASALPAGWTTDIDPTSLL